MADDGVGIEPTTVEMRLDGQIVKASSIIGTGEVLHLPEVRLDNGVHTIIVSATDVVGNPGVQTRSFTMMYEVYLPIIMR